jgi:hypothetical protein
MTDSEIFTAMFLVFWGILFLAASTVIVRAILSILRIILSVFLIPFRVVRWIL